MLRTLHNWSLSMLGTFSIAWSLGNEPGVQVLCRYRHCANDYSNWWSIQDPAGVAQRKFADTTAKRSSGSF